MKPTKAVWAIPIPNFGAGAVSGLFTASFNGTKMPLEFKWFGNSWHVWATLPTGEIRQAGVYPNVISWYDFLDYGIVFASDLCCINQDDLQNTKLYLIEWK